MGVGKGKDAGTEGLVRKSFQEIINEKASRCSCNSSSRMDGRVLFRAEQADSGRNGSTKASGGNHRKQRVLQVLHLRARMGARRSTVSRGIRGYQEPRRQGGRVARRIRFAVAAQEQVLYLGQRRCFSRRRRHLPPYHIHRPEL